MAIIIMVAGTTIAFAQEGYTHAHDLNGWHMYSGYHFGGMHLLWWFVWLILLFWIFALPYDIPGQRKKKDYPLDILQKRFASGQITTEEYQERKKILEDDLAKMSSTKIAV